jgi:hypothetical protein
MWNKPIPDRGRSDYVCWPFGENRPLRQSGQLKPVVAFCRNVVNIMEFIPAPDSARRCVMKVVVRRRIARLFVGQEKKWTSSVQEARSFPHCSEALDFCLKHPATALQIVIIFEEPKLEVIVEASRMIRLPGRRLQSGSEGRIKTRQGAPPNIRSSAS